MLSNTDIELTTAKDHREARLKNALDKVKEEYHHILIDYPPALSWLTINAFTSICLRTIKKSLVHPGFFR